MNHQEPFKIIEQPIPFGERLGNAIQSFFYLLALVPTCLVMAPVNFFRILFTSKRQIRVLDIPLPGMLENQDDVDAWKKQHDDLYGSDD